MKDETAAWLEPMLMEADVHEIDVSDLFLQASMPMREAPELDPVREMLHEIDIPEVSHQALDWVRFGQLLRERLGWTNYPEAPA